MVGGVTGALIKVSATGQNVSIPNLSGVRIAEIPSVGSGTTVAQVDGLIIEDLAGVGASNDLMDLFVQTGGSANKGNIRLRGAGWNDGHLRLENDHLWLDKTNRVLRLKQATGPTTETDGAALMMAVGATAAVTARCGNVSMDPPNISSESTGTATVTVTGLAACDVCTCVPRMDFDDDLTPKGCFGTTDTLNLWLYSPHRSVPAAIDAAAQTVDYCCFRK